ncbi:signal peptide peptidase SppA [Aurantibacillus circumpalustris]|uniref:signal peptide peptidase SppA n=1 Tax=Aurantibacillus circumpalustris TaxID=3036359 RepID=UPI00295B53F7|nr:signal peptide peptidase SppA [Aurantibacillus circumpalustris]
MKQFFGAFFGSILGIIISTLLAIFITIAVVKSSFKESFNDKEDVSAAKANSVLKIDIEGEIHEREKQNPFKDFGDLGPFAGNTGLGLNTLLKKIESAEKDENIKGIYLMIKNMRVGSASVLELRNALQSFKKSGKFIYAYSENYSQQEYFLASVSTKVFLNPQGSLTWKGLGASLMFFKHSFEKLDIEMQVFRHGKFKSAVEPFLLDKMSQANRYQSKTFLMSIWNTMLNAISKDRNLNMDELNRMANNLEIKFPENALGKFVDVLAYEDEVMDAIKKKIALKDTDKLKFLDLDKYEPKAEIKLKGGKIAVIYANGSISSGEGDDDQIGSDRLAKAIKDARLDDKIKAIVLRVNSPGGSALASDVIWREVVLAKKVKPTVVSMGNLAASGGYYISCAADRIFAQPNTITGSIGVFGIIPNLQKMLENKLGITMDTVNTNKHSDMGTGLRRVSETEYTFIQSSVEKVYDTFTKRVAEGRNMSQADVDSIGQGRVWTGADALKINLVDEIGGLNDAIAYAAKKAKLTEYKLTELPKQKSPFDELFGKKESEMETRMIKRNLGPVYTYFKQLQNVFQLEGVQARLPFEIIMN